MSGDAARTLATLLVNTAPLWHPAPFHDDPPWVSSTPALTSALLAFTDAELFRLENDPDALQHCIGNLAPVLAELQIAAAACLDHPAAVSRCRKPPGVTCRAASGSKCCISPPPAALPAGRLLNGAAARVISAACWRECMACEPRGSASGRAGNGDSQPAHHAAATQTHRLATGF
ncbi:MAG: hypothetical protein ACOY9J_10715 [Pseudomonadota bacterium]